MGAIELPLPRLVEFCTESPLGHGVEARFIGHFGMMPKWPIFLPLGNIARLSRVSFLEDLEDDVETRGDGWRPGLCRRVGSSPGLTVSL